MLLHRNFKSTLVGVALVVWSPLAPAVCDSYLVQRPVEGLFDSIPRSVEMPVGTLWLSTTLMGLSQVSGLSMIQSLILDARGSVLGAAERHFARDRRTMLFHGINTKHVAPEGLVDLAPSFIDHPSAVPLVRGRGIPTSVFITLSQMRLVGVEFGRLREASTETITNAVTLLQLGNRPSIRQWIEAHPGSVLPGELIATELMSTNTGRYVGTTLTQAGLRVAEIEVTGVQMIRVDEVLKWWGLPGAIARARGDLRDDARVPARFRLRLGLAPI